MLLKVGKKFADNTWSNGKWNVTKNKDGKFRVEDAL
jgi:hypothetical protein